MPKMRSELRLFGRVFCYAEQLVGGNAEKFGKGGKLRRVRQRFAPFEGGEPLRGYARVQGKAVPRKTAGKTLFRDFAADMIFFHLFYSPEKYSPLSLYPRMCGKSISGGVLRFLFRDFCSAALSFLPFRSFRFRFAARKISAAAEIFPEKAAVWRKIIDNSAEICYTVTNGGRGRVPRAV